MAQRRKLLGGLSLSSMGMKDSRLGDRPLPSGFDQVSAEPSENALARRNSAPGAASCEGRLAGIERDRIVGWAWDAASPLDSVEVELFVGSVCVGRGRADKFDASLAGRLDGNGMHRFELQINRIPDAPPPLVVRAVISGTDIELEPPLTLSLSEAERLLASTDYLGRVTGIENGSLCGWILNRSNPHEPPRLTLWDGETKILSGSPGGRVRVAIDTGATKRAYRFELPLPASALDGGLHSYSVRLGDSGPEVAGSPIVFGPTDVASLGKVIASLSERLQKLDQRLDYVQPDIENTVIEKQMAGRIVDRLDMLLHIHRDGIEREMSVMRRQISELLRLTPEANAEVIPPVETHSVLADELAPWAPQVPAMKVIEHSQPGAAFVLRRNAGNVSLSGNLKWSNQDGGVIVKGSGALNLTGELPGRATLILKGSGAQDPLLFNGFVATFQGRVLTGRVEVGENGRWAFAGTTRETATRDMNNNTLMLTQLGEGAKSGTSFCLEHIAVYLPGKAPEQLDPVAPHSTTVFLGTDDADRGWYPFEITGQGGHCWMGDHGDIQFRIRQTGQYELHIPELRPLSADIMPNLRILSGGVPMAVEVSALKGTQSAVRVSANFCAPARENDLLRVRLSFPKECVRSPMELGMNSDQRPLTVAVRSATLVAIES